MEPLELETRALPVDLRPAPSLLKYYALSSLLAGPLFVLPFAFLFVRYRTLRYRIDEDGISMRWGAMWRREVSLNYGRIQDIHLSSNVVERWLGLGKIQIQTASASSKAEMTLEGLPDLRGMRDFLYGRMRGAGEAPSGPDRLDGDRPDRIGRSRTDLRAGPEAELTRVLRTATGELRAIRELLERGRGDGASDPGGPHA